MRTYDFAPLWRASVGFDRLFDLINDTQRLEAQDDYPPYDIVRTGDDTYRISLALAGFSPDGITITAQQNNTLFWPRRRTSVREPGASGRGRGRRGAGGGERRPSWRDGSL